MIIILAHYETGESDAVGIAGTHQEAEAIIYEWQHSRRPDSDPFPVRFALIERGPGGEWVETKNLEN
jgi:hypothetical protein